MDKNKVILILAVVVALFVGYAAGKGCLTKSCDLDNKAAISKSCDKDGAYAGDRVDGKDDCCAKDEKEN